MVYSATIKFVDDCSVMRVLISDMHGIENLPEGLTDEDIFFYGLSQEQAKRALLSQESCEGEWLILALDCITTVGDVRPCMKDGEDIISGPTVTEDK